LREDHGKCTRLLVEIVAMNVRFHLSQDKINQSIVMTASRIINQKVEVTEVAVEDLVAEATVDDMAEIEMEEEELAVMEEIAVAVIALEEIDHGKCTK
jgi:hypothetical protein